MLGEHIVNQDLDCEKDRCNPPVIRRGIKRLWQVVCELAGGVCNVWIREGSNMDERNGQLIRGTFLKK